MQIDKYTDRLKAIIQSGQSLALRQGHQQFTPMHLLMALLDDEDRLAASLIEASGGRPEALRQTVESELAKLPRVEGSGAGQIHMTPETARIFDQAEQAARKAGDSFVTVEYLLLAMAMATGTTVGNLIQQAGITQIRNRIYK
jgi:ATP-dependent Clp protease ATP-binding subunit ClpB